MPIFGVLPLPKKESSDRISDDDFEYFRNVIRDRAGIALSENKRALLESRLVSRVQARGLQNLREYRALIEGLPRENAEWQSLINAITTNKTEFFREIDHFKYLTENFLSEWRLSGKNKLSLWSAASSTGEEAYSAAICLSQSLDSSITWDVLGTDIDTEVIKTAQTGVYPRSHVVTVPEAYAHSGFSFGTGSIEHWVRVKPSIKAKVSFQQFNLFDAPYPWQARFDVIFCRNVLIYFSKEGVCQVADALYEAAAPGALLLIGHSESFHDIKTSWTYIQPSIFRKTI